MHKTSLYFCSNYGEIAYHYAKPEELLFYQGPIIRPVVVDAILIETQGQGHGTTLMRNFIQEMKQKNVGVIYLVAEYFKDSFRDSNQTEEQGLRRLVNFYKRLGFKSEVKEEFEPHFQIDMSLVLSSSDGPTN